MQLHYLDGLFFIWDKRQNRYVETCEVKKVSIALRGFFNIYTKRLNQNL